jgi:hypothetical protein
MALNDFFVVGQEGKELRMQAVPKLHDKVSNVQPHPSLRAAFYFVNGQKICWELKDKPGEIIAWQISIDTFFNKYIYCERSGAKAYFRVQEAMMYFTHFDGQRDTLLYHFYLSAHKVSLGLERKLVIHDYVPVNKVFGGLALVLQDFLAPFYLFLQVDYKLQYPQNFNAALTRDIAMKGSLVMRRGKASLRTMQFKIQIGANGLQSFYFNDGQKETEALCVKDIIC